MLEPLLVVLLSLSLVAVLELVVCKIVVSIAVVAVVTTLVLLAVEDSEQILEGLNSLARDLVALVKLLEASDLVYDTYVTGNLLIYIVEILASLSNCIGLNSLVLSSESQVEVANAYLIEVISLVLLAVDNLLIVVSSLLEVVSISIAVAEATQQVYILGVELDSLLVSSYSLLGLTSLLKCLSVVSVVAYLVS